jgi:hypothetical protein
LEATALLHLRDPLEAIHEGRPPQVSASPALSPDRIDTRPRLDTHTLSAFGLLKRGEVRGVSLVWSPEDMGACTQLLVAIDLRDPSSPFVLAEAYDDLTETTTLQIIPLERAAGRWYMRCPITGERSTTLYLRACRLGGRKGQALGYHL